MHSNLGNILVKTKIQINGLFFLVCTDFKKNHNLLLYTIVTHHAQIANCNCSTHCQINFDVWANGDEKKSNSSFGSKGQGGSS